MDSKFAVFGSFNRTKEAVQHLSASDNDRNNFKRPALTVNHILESMIRRVFPKIVVRRLPRRDPLGKCHIHSALSNTATYPKGFRAFSVLLCIPRLLSLRVCPLRKSECKCDCISILQRFLLPPFSDVFALAVYFISFFETSDSKILPIKYSSQ